MPYSEQLKKLKLPSLEYGRKRGDMIDVFKFMENIYHTDSLKLKLAASNRTRGHKKKLVKQRSKLNVRSSYFSNRVINLWNDLPDAVVNSRSEDAFKKQLDNHWKNKTNKFDPSCYYTV